MSNELPESGRIDPADHYDPAWHIHEIAHDFDLIDAWRLPVAGSYDQFPELTDLFLSLDLAHDEASKATAFLFAVRFKLGELFGWDDDVLTLPIPGCDEVSLRDRLPDELRQTVDDSDEDGSDDDGADDDGGDTDFQLVYQTETESVLELSNSTVHAAIHLAWVEVNERDYVGQMGIYVKNRGSLGRIYMPAIAPFRHYIVYPALMRRLGPAWQQRTSTP